MANSTREIRRRVKSVKNVRQITGAMELVAAAKMQRAVTAVQQSRRYASLATGMLKEVTENMDMRHHPLLMSRPRRHLLFILLTSNRGLAGGFNARVCEAAHQYMKERRANAQAVGDELKVSTATVGKKGRDYLMQRGYNVVAEFARSERATTAADIAPLVRLALDDYLAEVYDEVAVCYTDFVSMMRQEPRVREILPLNKLVAAENLQEGNGFLFEPDAQALLNTLIPRFLEVQLYQMVLESHASEHAARMLAMRNATDAADDLTSDLTLTLNQLRQSNITRELAEISAGRLALGA